MRVTRAPLLISGISAQFLDVERGIPLGLGASEFSEVEVKLPLGSRLVFYSDGITEAGNPADEEYGCGASSGTFLANGRLRREPPR